MRPEIERFTSSVNHKSTIRNAMSKMGASRENKYHAGLTVVVDENGVVVGVITDGDIRRGVAAGIEIDDSVMKAANLNPFTLVAESIDLREQYKSQLSKHNIESGKLTRVILVDDKGQLYDVIDSVSLEIDNRERATIAIYGMGFVGLTLAATFANVGFKVIGYDLNHQIIASLKDGKPTFFERGLETMLNSPTVKNNVIFTDNKNEVDAIIHIVSVGTPIDESGLPNLVAISLVTEFIKSRLKQHDLVIFRSTLPVGTMRSVILPILESSGLLVGVDFELAFAPERTVEGNALQELRTLPQIIGGYDKQSARSASNLFRNISNLVIEVDSLEAAELAKLMNNTYRDLYFAFANEVSNICAELNLNAFRLIKAINSGYPREQIALPSPGVGGPCLTKDSILYSNPYLENIEMPILGLASRSINSGGPKYVFKLVQKYCKNFGFEIEDLRILIVGVAFKGEPETSDIRDSVSIELIKLLPNQANIKVKDFVVASSELRKLNLALSESNLEDSIADSDVVLFMNNHRLNSEFNIINALNRTKDRKLFFDGWDMFDQEEIENNRHVIYATMGYMTKCE